MSKYAAYFAIEKELKSAGFDVDRSDLVSKFTDGRKDGLSTLNDKEYKAFIYWLNDAFDITAPTEPNGHWQNTPENRMRRKVYSLFVYKMNYTPKQFQDWIIKYGLYHKSLNDYTHDQLVELVTQANKVYATFINGLK